MHDRHPMYTRLNERLSVVTGSQSKASSMDFHRRDTAHVCSVSVVLLRVKCRRFASKPCLDGFIDEIVEFNDWLTWRTQAAQTIDLQLDILGDQPSSPSAPSQSSFVDVEVSQRTGEGKQFWRLAGGLSCSMC
jgi:hypothetical protein